MVCSSMPWRTPLPRIFFASPLQAVPSSNTPSTICERNARANDDHRRHTVRRAQGGATTPRRLGGAHCMCAKRTCGGGRLLTHSRAPISWPYTSHPPSPTFHSPQYTMWAWPRERTTIIDGTARCDGTRRRDNAAPARGSKHTACARRGLVEAGGCSRTAVNHVRDVGEVAVPPAAHAARADAGERACYAGECVVSVWWWWRRR